MKPRLRDMKRGLAFVMTLVLFSSMFFVMPTETKAAEAAGEAVEDETTKVRYVKYQAEDCALGQAPTYSGANKDYGYIFGGWYTMNDAGKYAPLRKGDEAALEKAKQSDKVYAKFVPAYVLGVKCQNFAATASDSETTSMRVFTSVDSRNYEKVGFDFKRMDKNANTGKYSVYRIGTDGAQTTSKTYIGLRVKNSTGTESRVYNPNEIFGGDASKFILGWRLEDILNEKFDSIIYIRPYWVTLDGTKVYGLTKYAHVEDSLPNDKYQGYINVPVNLKDAKEVLAGRMNIAYDSSQLEFVEAERGRVFQDMEAAKGTVDSKSVVKCVGVVRTVVDKKTNKVNSVTPNDIYINLRFGLKSDGANQFDFAASAIDFGNLADVNSDEVPVDYNVWKVKSGYLPPKEPE